MKRIIYLLAVALVVSISFSSCQRKAITQEEIDEFSRQINERLEEINNNNKNNDTVITIDSTGTDTTVKINTNTPQTKQDTEITIIQRDNTNFGESIETVIIVFIAIITPFACLVLIVFFIIKGITSRQRDRNKLIEKAIENNYPLSEDFFASQKSPRTRLQSALVWLAWGIGIMGFFYIVAPTETVYAIGLIPLLVGIAKLITYFLEDRKKESEE
ncbi:MAG: hypothetical protein E7081_08305 [Bacteroidales bacterium]|nr:hypothetical protein [Bacteroidales bacterium]